MRGQVNLDIIIAYIAFIAFALFLVTYFSNLFKPFLDYYSGDVLVKRGLILEQEILSNIDLNDFDKLCSSISVPGLTGVNISYDIAGFNVFYHDYSNSSLANGLNIVRDFNVLRIERLHGGSGNYQMIFTIPQASLKVFSENTTTGDSLSITSDNYNNNKITVLLTPNSTYDKSYILTTPYSSTSFMLIESVNSTVGLNGFRTDDSCGAGLFDGRDITHSEFFKSLAINGESVFVKVSADAWW